MYAPLIELQGVSVSLRHGKHYHQVLHEVNFSLQQGEHVVVVGENGAGKSTFLRLLRGEVWATSGNITWQHQGQPETSPIMGRRMTALVSHAKQEAYTRFAWRLSGEDVLLTAFSDAELLHFITDATQKRAVQNMAQRLKVTHLLSQEACTLSQGQLRLLLLGRALLKNPAVLLLDEYMDGLDATHGKNILKLLEECQCTMVVTAHRAQGIPAWIKQAYHLQAGRLQAFRQQKAPLIPQGLSQQKSGTCSFHNAPTLIDIHKGNVFVDRKHILYDISWVWRQGEHWQIVGANGSGKSTFLRLIAGAEYITFEEESHLHRYSFVQKCAGEKVNDLAGMRTGLLSDATQHSYAYDVTGLELALSGIDKVEGVYRTYSEEEYGMAENILQKFRLNTLADRHIRSLSTGQLRRLLLARLLMGAPELVLLDEPFSGLAHASYIAIRDMLEEEVHTRAVHVLLVSHYAEDRLPCINKSAHMQDGRLWVE